MFVRLYKLLLLLVLSSAFLPAVAAELNANTATIILDSNVKNIDVKVNDGGQGCSAGQMWDIVLGRCTSAVSLRSVSTSRACTCTCPQGGSCTSSQSGSYQVMGWRLPPNGAEQVSYNSSTSWGSCVQVTNACITGPIQPGTGSGTSGEVFYYVAFVCNSNNSAYWSGVLYNTQYKDMIIAAYRSFNSTTRRCPEVNGFTYWQTSWRDSAYIYMGKNPGTSFEKAMAETWTYPTLYSMQEGAAKNGESLPSNQYVLNQWCTDEASSAYGRYTPAVYQTGSGDLCRIL